MGYRPGIPENYYYLCGTRPSFYSCRCTIIYSKCYVTLPLAHSRVPEPPRLSNREIMYIWPFGRSRNRNRLQCIAHKRVQFDRYRENNVVRVDGGTCWTRCTLRGSESKRIPSEKISRPMFQEACIIFYSCTVPCLLVFFKAYRNFNNIDTHDMSETNP